MRGRGRPFVKGNIPWNTGTKGVKKANSGSFKVGQPSPRKGKFETFLKGQDNHNWKGGVTSENQKQRVRFQITIRKEVLERDNYTCQTCGKRGGVLHVDHIQSWAEYAELRFNMDNCRTLCEPCHYFVTWGKVKPDHVKTWGRNRRNISI